jgi:hypothetical protein
MHDAQPSRLHRLIGVCDEEYNRNCGGGFSKILQSLSRAKNTIAETG